MNGRIIAGVALFIALVGGFVFFLLEINDLAPDFNEADIAGTRNNQQSPDVVEPGEAGMSDVPLVMKAATQAPDGRGLTIELSDLSGFRAGDAIALYIPQDDRTYDGQVSNSSLTEAGNRVLTGFLRSTGRDYRFVFTVGQYQTFGTLGTPNGRYQLETRDGIGRIVSVADIRQDLDFTEPDYVIPNRRELPPQAEPGPG
jgi:hypothetical protein